VEDAVNEPQETSGSGAPIFRHHRRLKPFQHAEGDPEAIEAITRHITEHIGEPAFVYHEMRSDLVHIDVHVVPPRPERDMWTLVTTGMSDLPMNTPGHLASQRFAELMVCLPSSWPLPEGGQIQGSPLEEERWYWPIRWLKLLARLPHEYSTWLGPGHTVPNGDPPLPYADETELCCMLVMAPATVEPEFWSLKRPGHAIHFYALWPLHRDEMELKLEQGLDALLDRLEALPPDGLSAAERIDPTRINACPR
jgi:hypothetical protein